MVSTSRAVLLKKLKTLDKKHTQKMLEVMRITAKKRVLKELLRQQVRREERAALAGKGPTKSDNRRGRRERWPGMCRACCMRHFGEDGGSGHVREKCKATLAWLKRQARGKVKK